MAGFGTFGQRARLVTLGEDTDVVTDSDPGTAPPAPPAHDEPPPAPERRPGPTPLPAWVTAAGGALVGALAGVAIASSGGGAKPYVRDGAVGAGAGLLLGVGLGMFANREKTA